ncbi:MAG: hypothetical protein OHK0044_26740 [Burkholderiaceae bacterium]
MIVRRRTWSYRLAGQCFPQTISFADRVTAAMARRYLRGSVGNPIELWARSGNEAKPRHP